MDWDSFFVYEYFVDLGGTDASSIQLDCRTQSRIKEVRTQSRILTCGAANESP